MAETDAMSAVIPTETVLSILKFKNDNNKIKRYIIEVNRLFE